MIGYDPAYVDGLYDAAFPVGPGAVLLFGPNVAIPVVVPTMGELLDAVSWSWPERSSVPAPPRWRTIVLGSRIERWLAAQRQDRALSGAVGRARGC